MKDDTNAINILVVLPFSPSICRYSINDSKTTHATTYKEVQKIIKETCLPALVPSMDFLDKRIPFLIDVKKQEVFELETQKEDISSQIQKMVRDSLYSVIPSSKVENTNFWRKSQSRYWRR